MKAFCPRYSQGALSECASHRLLAVAAPITPLARPFCSKSWTKCSLYVLTGNMNSEHRKSPTMVHFGLRPGGLECDADGLRIAGLALLKSETSSWGRKRWRPAPLPEIQRALSRAYGRPIDAAAKLRGLAVVASALNDGELARAQIAAVLLRLPDLAEAARAESIRLGEPKAAADTAPVAKDWDPDKHPRPGGPPNAGRFARHGRDQRRYIRSRRGFARRRAQPGVLACQRRRR